MNRLVEYLAVVAIGLALVAFVVSPIVHKVADSMNASAAMIEKATSHDPR